MILYYHITVILSVFLSGVFLVRWRKGISVHFPLIFLLIPIINLGYLKVATAQNTYEALLANGIEYLDGCFLELIFLLYVMSYCKIRIPKILTAGMLCVGSTIFFFAINLAKSDLLYKSAELRTQDGLAYLVKEYGFIHTIYYITIAVYLIANLCAIIYSFTRKNVSKINSLLLLIVYLVIMVAFLVGKPIHPGIELLPAAYTFSQVIFLIVMSKITLYDISESAMATISERGDIGFASFDLRMRYLGCTDPMLECIPELDSLYIDEILKPSSEDLANILGCVRKLRKGSDDPFFYVSRGGISYRVTLGYLCFGNKIRGYQLRAEDNTPESRRLEALQLREQQKEIEAKMLKLEKSAADAANKAKSSFLAEMSHEIRTPINAIIGMNEMIMRTSKEKDTLDYSANIDFSSKTLLSLINTILDFSKIEDGKMEINPVSYKTRDMLGSLVVSVRERLRAKGLRFELEVDETLPSQLYGDDLRVRQIIQNLLTNAVKYTEKGSVTLSVKDGGRENGAVFLEVTVSDTGIGIRQEDMDKLFESFERLDEKRNRNIEGTGLGMSIVTKLLGMMGSELSVKSEYGKGSDFSFRLRQVIDNEAPIGSFSADDAVSRRSLHKCELYAPQAKILVVDDNDMNLKVAGSLLGLFGIAPRLAASGIEAIDLIRQENFDIVLLDHMMPDMDGIETLRKLEEEGLRKDSCRYIALSANAIIGAKESYLAAGFDGYLSKPIEVAALEETLNEYLSGDKKQKRSGEEPAGQENPGENLLSALPEELDTAMGMHYCMDDEDFYSEMLGDYYTSSEEKLSSLQNFFDTEDSENYRILIHAIKSSSKTIGAAELASEAQELENAAKNGETDFVAEHHAVFCARMKSLAEGIKTALDRSGGKN